VFQWAGFSGYNYSRYLVGDGRGGGRWYEELRNGFLGGCIVGQLLHWTTGCMVSEEVLMTLLTMQRHNQR
jgi:hypothetical protein